MVDDVGLSAAEVGCWWADRFKTLLPLSHLGSRALWAEP